MDTEPLVPGEKNSQAIVRFNLPYTGEFLYDFTAPVAVGGLSLLIPEDSGLKLQGSALTQEGVQAMQDGSNLIIYTSPGLNPEETIQVSLTGKPRMENSVFPGSKNFSQGIAIGGSLLGLALLGAGIWWWRRSKEENTEMSLGEVLTELEQLDEAHARGEISEKEYQETRASLIAEVELG